VNKKGSKKLSMSVTRALYGTILLGYMMLHIDDGVLSVSSEGIIHDLDMSESKLGLVEAAMYIGILVGSIACPFLFAYVSAKWLLITAVFFNAIAVGSWVLTTNFVILALCRTLNGVFLVSIIDNLVKSYGFYVAAEIYFETNRNSIVNSSDLLPGVDRSERTPC
jgi:MFS family permease